MKKLVTISLILAVLISSAFAMGKRPRKNEEAVYPHPVSLQAVMQKEFDGNDLRIRRILAEKDVYTRYYISYQSGEFVISGIMNVPKGKGPFPVLILNHGYINLRYYTVGRGLKREQDYLARKGYVVIHTDYRNHGDSDIDEDNDFKMYIGYVEDVLNVISAVKSSDFEFFDKENIGMLGHSLGGGIALSIMATKPKLVKAYVLFAPISIDYRDNFERWIAKQRPELAKKIVWKYGAPGIREEIRTRYGSPESNPEFWDNISVKTFLDNIEDPVSVHHGTADESVPFEWTLRLVKAFQEKGKEIELYVYEGEKHEFIPKWRLVMERTAAFFDSKLKTR